MPGFLDQLDKNVPIPKSPEYTPNLNTPIKSSFLEKLDKNDRFESSSNPQDGPILNPNPEFNTSDLSRINVDKEATNNGWDDAINSFKRGVDQIQIATIEGKLAYSPFGDAPYEVKDNYDPKLMKLQNKLKRNIITPQEYSLQKEELDKDYNTALDKIAQGKADVSSNEAEISNEPVSKGYEAMSSIIQAEGDQANLWDRIRYTGPNTIGSSAALMIPQLAATFANNITKTLLRSSAAYVLGPEAGIPANIIGTVGAIAFSVGEVLWGRHQESMGEVGSTIMDAQKKLSQDYMDKNHLTSADEIPEDVQRDIRIQSRKGADMQYKENMVLAVNDIVEALAMPMGNLGAGLGALGKGTKAVSEAIESAKNYSKFTRTMTTLGKLGTTNYLEKFEEGSQYAMQKRAEDQIYGTHNYTNGGFLKNILDDSYDTIASLNYSLIPGIDMRGSGKYSNDKEFQFSENSGGLLATLMGGIPAAISIRSDLKAYKAASKDLQDNGIINVDGKFSRIDNTILAKYFDRDLRQVGDGSKTNSDVFHLISSIKSLSKQKDDSGNPVITPEAASEFINSLTEKQDLYSSIASRIDKNVFNDKLLGFRRSPELRNAVQLAKLDTFHTVNSIVENNKLSSSLALDIENRATKDNQMFGDPKYREIQNLDARYNALREMKEAHLAQKDNVDEMSKSERGNYNRHLEYIDSEMSKIDKTLEDDKKAHDDYVAPGDALIDLHKKGISNDMYLADSKALYSKLSNLKDRSSVMSYYEDNKERISTDVLQEETPEEETEVEPEVKPTSPRSRTDIDPDSVTPTATSTSTLTEADNKTGSTEVENPEAVQNRATMVSLLKKVADDTLAAADRIEAFKEFTKLNRLDPVQFADDAAARTIAKIALDEMKVSDNAVHAVIDKIQEVSLMVNTKAPLSRFFIDSNGLLDWTDLASDIPPLQADDNWVDTENDNTGITFRSTPGTDHKILSGLSLATRNIEGKRSVEGKWYDQFDESGKLKFSDQDHQQLVNTNVIKVGDKLTVRADIPSDFNSSDSSDYNYDQIPIGLYKTVQVGGVSSELRVGYLHTIAKLDDLLSRDVRDGVPVVNIEAEKSLLRNHRTDIIRGGKDAQFSFDITDKGFGYVNTNDKYTTIFNAIGEDDRPRLTYVESTGQVYKGGKQVLDIKNGASSGATMLLLPNETSLGTVYVPMYVKKGKIGVDPAIHTKVSDSIVSFLEEDARHTAYLTEAKKYVFVSNNPKHLTTLGVSGVYVSPNAENPTIFISEKRFSKKDGNIKDVHDALANVYFSISREMLTHRTEKTREDYQSELMHSPVIQSNVTKNSIIRSRVKDGTYSFLPKEQTNSYFSQHTIVLSNLVRLDKPIEITREEVLGESSSTSSINPARKFFEEIAKIDPYDQSPANAERVGKLRENLPPGVKPEDVNTLLVMKGKFDEIPAYRAAFPEKFPSVASIEEETKPDDLDLDLLSGLDDMGDFEDPELTPKNNLLISDKISGTVQNSMIESIAFQLFTNVKSGDVDIKNSDKVKNDLTTMYNKWKGQYATLSKLKEDPEAWDKRVIDTLKSTNNKTDLNKNYNALPALIEKYSLMLEHWDELLKRARKFLSEQSEEVLSEEDDYYESDSSDEREENSFNEFADDANRQRDEKQHLDINAKRLLMFIPKVEPTIPEEFKETGKTYKEIKNSLALPTFNNFNDTWQKILGVTTSVNRDNARFFDATRSGLMSMLEALKDASNPPVVQIFGEKLASASKQVQNATYRKVRLSYIKNETGINITHKVEKRDDQGDIMLQGEYSEFRISASDKRQGVRNVVEELTSEMLNFRGSERRLFVPVLNESTNIVNLRIDSSYAKELLEEVKEITDPKNGHYETIQIGKNLKSTNTLNQDSLNSLYLIIKNKIGINLSRPAFDKMMRFHESAITGYPNHQVATLSTLINILDSFSKADEGSQYKSIKNSESINVFSNETRGINTIARYEHQFRTQRSSGAYRVGGKSYFPYNRGNYLSDFFQQFYAKRANGPGYFIDDKFNNDTYAKGGRTIYESIKENTDFTRSFDNTYELGTNSLDSNEPIKMLSKMTPREHKLTKFKSFQNKGGRRAVFFFDTLSDKVTKPKITYNRIDINSITGSIDEGTIKLPNDIIAEMFRYFEGEYRRISAVRDQNTSLPKYKLIKGYHDRDGKEGMGKYFLGFHFMNKAVLDVDNPKLSSLMYNEDGSFKNPSPQVEDMIASHFQTYMNKVFKDSKDDARNNELWTSTPVQYGSEIRYVHDIKDLVDHRYLTEGIMSKPGDKVNNPGVMYKLGMQNHPAKFSITKGGMYNGFTLEDIDRIVDFTLVDYTFNYMMFTMDMWTITGDPAQAGKLADNDSIVKRIRERWKGDTKMSEKQVLLAHIQSTFDNLYKRNASFVASGDVAVWDKEHYNVSVAKDISIDSPELEQYKALFPDNESGIIKAYKKGDLTDAQEVTTVEEHLDQLLALGSIDSNQHRKSLYLYDRAAFNKRYGGTEELDAVDKAEAYKIIFQPQKPVQRSYVTDSEMQMSKQFYIKTSAFPLIPSMLDGAMLDLLNDMKKNDVQRVAFVSGVKQGVSGEKDIFDKDGAYNKSFFENNVNTLHRNGFRIQLDVPYKEYKEDIREGTQKSKLLFVDIHADTQMIMRGESKTAGELNDLYTDTHRKVIDIKRDSLFKELGATMRNSNVVLTPKFFKNLSKMLLREGEGRGYALNSLLGLELNDNGDFTIPLTFLPNAAQMEPVINSIVSNRMTRLRMSGKSGIQASEFILKTGKKGKVVDGDNLAEALKDNRDIVWTKPEYANLEKLRYQRIENAEGDIYIGSADSIPEGYESKPAQIIMSTHLIDPRKKDKSGHAQKIDIKSYINKDGFLDLNKIDPELLQLNGFRIPFQGHNSAMWFEIVGFLPNATGDMLVVPGEIAAQMGSDYDVDKLYYYLYNYYFDENDNIHRIHEGVTLPKEEVKEGDNPTSLHGMEDDDFQLKIHQNTLMDIEKSVLTSPSIIGAILDPLSFSDVEETINRFVGDEDSKFVAAASPIYQDNVYFSNITGKLGVGISANNNTSHALAQVANLFIVGEGMKFLDENGDPYSDYMDVNRPSSNSESSEKAEMFKQAVKGYLADFQGYDMNYYQDEAKVAHKIVDKISWTDETKASPEYARLLDLLKEADDKIKGEDMNEAHNSIASVMYHLVNMVKVNSTEDKDIIESSSILNNGNGTNKVYTHTYVSINNNELLNNNSSQNRTAWRLDKVYTFPDPITGKVYKISNLISQILGISVDNAKEQLLGKFGINEQNFNTALTMIRTGFSLNCIYTFINQPILLEYYKSIGGTSDIYQTDRRSNKRVQAVKDIFTKYSEMYGIDDTYEDEDIKAFGFKELGSSLNEPISEKNVVQQLDILKAYLKYKDMADSLQNLASVINIDTKGAPKNMASTLAKRDKIDSLANNPVLGNIDNYTSRTIPGLFIDVPQMIVDLFMNRDKPVFAYGSEAYTYAISKLFSDTYRPIYDQEEMDNIYGQMKEFIYSGFPFPDGESIDDARDRLTFGENSLQDRIMRLQNLPINKGNDWLESIRPVSSINPEDPKMININFSSEDEFVERVSELWESSLFDDKNTELRDFARDMVKYTLYVSPQEFGTSSIIRYIPVSYLKYIGFDKYLNEINESTSDESLLQKFPRQFVQHNKDMILTAKADKIAIPSSRIYEKSKDGKNIVLNQFSLPRITDNLTNNNARDLIRESKEGKVYPRFLSVYIDEAYEKQIYEGVMNPVDLNYTYYRIDQLGSRNSSEYHMNGDPNTSFGPVSKSNVIFPSSAGSGVRVPSKESSPEGNPSKNIGGKDYLNPSNSADDILTGLIEQNNNLTNLSGEQKKYAAYYQFLAKAMHYKGLHQVKITYDENLKSAGLTSNKGMNVNFNIPEMLKGRTGLKGELEKQRTILHEFIHSLTEMKMREKGKEAMGDILKVWKEYRKNIVNTKEKVRGIPKGALDAELFSVIKEDFDDLYRSGKRDAGENLRQYADRIIANDEDLRSLLDKTSENLRILMAQDVIPKAEYNLNSNQERFNDIRKYVRSEFGKDIVSNINKYYAYFNPFEFMTESMTNRHTQKELQSMGSIWKTLVSAIKDFIASILGIEDYERSLFNDAIDSVFNFLDLGDKKRSEPTDGENTLPFADESIQSNKKKLDFKKGKC